MSGAPLVRLAGVWKWYSDGARPAVRDLWLEVTRHELLAILGPSGCGKTTTLRLIAGLERPDEGVIEIGGCIVAEGRRFLPPEERGVGLVFQDCALFPHLTVEENIAFGLWRLSRGERKRRVDELLSLLGLEEYRSRYPHQLSGGNSNAWRSREPWRRIPRSCCWTSPSPTSMPSYATGCGRSCGVCSVRWVSRSCS